MALCYLMQENNAIIMLEDKGCKGIEESRLSMQDSQRNWWLGGSQKKGPLPKDRLLTLNKEPGQKGS